MKRNELYHYGVKGMKWGVRRYQPYPKSGRKKGVEIGYAAKRKLKYTSPMRQYIKNMTKAYSLAYAIPGYALIHNIKIYKNTAIGCIGL